MNFPATSPTKETSGVTFSVTSRRPQDCGRPTTGSDEGNSSRDFRMNRMAVHHFQYRAPTISGNFSLPLQFLCWSVDTRENKDQLSVRFTYSRERTGLWIRSDQGLSHVRRGHATAYYAVAWFLRSRTTLRLVGSGLDWSFCAFVAESIRSAQR